MTTVWQYLIGEKWHDCTTENSKLLSFRRNNPTLEPIFLQNDKGILWGNPETRQMKIRLNDDLDAQDTALRIGIKETEEAIHVVEYINLDNDVESHILIPPKAQELLSHINQPNSDRLDVNVGPDCLVAQNGNIYMKTAGNTLVRCRYGITNLSYSQFREMTSSRFSWMFQGPFRTNRMHRAVRELGETLPADESLVLYDLFDRVFDPNDEEATEYGPFQFQDFLISTRGKFGLATQLMDQFHTIAAEDWQPFSLVQNAKIESHRKKELPGVKLTIGGVVYMIVFDSGAGSSGENAVLIRPSRYNKILTSIEEQFQEESLRDLFAALTEIGFNPVEFVQNTDAEEMLTSEQKETIIPLLHKVQHPTRYMGTLIQQLMPRLLDKFKECNIKMSTEEAINEKKLCPKIFSTLPTGLSVPLGARHTFKEMISFIHQQQSWIVPEVGISIRQCDICLDSEMPCVLTHCGQNGACLKCWADSLMENNMTCMFCRQKVISGSLQISLDPTKEKPKPEKLRRSKRRKLGRKRSSSSL